MSSRLEIEERKTALRMALRNECLTGRRAPNTLLPPVRQLAAEYGISSLIVSQVLSELEQEGLLYTMRRLGTFVGKPVTPVSEYYVLLLPSLAGTEYHFRQVQVGLEERISALGGATIILTPPMLQESLTRQHLPKLAGVFDFNEMAYAPQQEAIKFPCPVVRFESLSSAECEADLISFDDIGGGRQATLHLSALGHRRIAFLGVHRNECDNLYGWSAEREAGWREALAQEGLPAVGLAFHPPDECEPGLGADQQRAGYLACKPLLLRPDVTAVVAANDAAAQGLLKALQESGVASERWPAVVGFDDKLQGASHNISSFRLPWDEIGRVAAELLWERSHGILKGAPVHRHVPMRLIQRLTSPTNWSLVTSHMVASHVAVGPEPVGVSPPVRAPNP